MARQRTVLFESWRGRYADSPRAVSEALEGQAHVRRVWVATSGQRFPSGTTTVRRHRAPYFARLFAADGLVANDIISRHVIKGPRLYYVQAWHGTPLKLLGHDEHSPAYGSGEHLRRMVRDVAKWDALISPSTSCTELLRSAFDYEGEVWETGYPRNDLLLSPSAELVRERVRKALGVAQDAFVVLNVPTWRDDQRDEQGGFSAVPGIDPSGLMNLRRSVVVLDRQHHNVRRPVRQAGAEVINVSAHPEVAELYLAADALVTDYSSAIYDFVVTGKPVVLYAPDLEKYAEMRGFYFDYHDWAPGPVAHTQEELTVELAALVEDATSVATSRRYEEFVARWCPWEDGQAGRRVADRLIAALG